jgi:DNA-binding MarR family transcriptional regulator
VPVAWEEKPGATAYDRSMPDPTAAEYEEASRLRIALRRFLHQSELITRRHGLSPRHYELLLLIKASAQSRSTVSELVELLRLTQSTVTELVQRAEEAGLLGRQQSSVDGRIVHLTLTGEGEQRLSASLSELGVERARLLDTLQRS